MAVQFVLQLLNYIDHTVFNELLVNADTLCLAETGIFDCFRLSIVDDICSFGFIMLLRIPTEADCFGGG